MGMVKTVEDCKKMLIEDSDAYAGAVERCIKVPLTDKQYVAFASLAYNVGPQAMCKSSAVKYFNAGDKQRACNALMNFIKAGGKVVSGLKNRREAERELCLAE
jgi:lysozyme